MKRTMQQLREARGSRIPTLPPRSAPRWTTSPGGRGTGPNRRSLNFACSPSTSASVTIRSIFSQDAPHLWAIASRICSDGQPRCTTIASRSSGRLLGHATATEDTRRAVG
jgi:hypothetical protein